MHPFYEPSSKLLSRNETLPAGLVSMAAYLLFWAAAIPIALRALKRYSGPAAGRGAPVAGQGAPDGALEILRGRYARGDIDLEEFLQRREVLERDR